jgi:O-6-methylguanine DNA methyltransferase
MKTPTTFPFARSIDMPSPIGSLRLCADAENAHLTGLFMSEHDPAPAAQTQGKPTEARFRGVLALAREQLDEYFRSDPRSGRREFDLPLLQVGTEFQRTVWGELLNIPFGRTISYGTLAERIGNPKAMRAVGLANGRNPISILVPCHRVIGANGSLTGYGGGIDNKRWLLEHEGIRSSLWRE